MKRRKIDFRSAGEVIRDIRNLQENGYRKLGNWNLTQICQHLEGTMNGGMDGFGFRLPWILRATVIKWGFRFALKRRKLGSGFPTFRVLRPTWSENEDDPTHIDSCIRSFERARDFQGSLEDYALLNNLSVDDWKEFMWIHASHHLSFLIPNEPANDNPVASETSKVADVV